MRIAIISDVHANLHALKEVKKGIDGAGVDLVVSAGDVVGYGAAPNHCCEIVGRLANHSVAGNHDIAALDRDSSGMNPYAARAALWTAEQLDGGSKSYLLSLKESLRIEVERHRAGIHHGSLQSVWEYLFEDDVDESLLRESGTEVLIFGHTHVPYVKRYREGLIVNPGSVGQPRDGDPRASYGILETDPLSCAIIRVDYDIEGASEAILRAGLPEMLADRLHRGF